MKRKPLKRRAIPCIVNLLVMVQGAEVPASYVNLKQNISMVPARRIFVISSIKNSTDYAVVLFAENLTIRVHKCNVILPL